MPENRSMRGVPLPGIWQACVLAAAVAGMWILWSEFRHGVQPPAVGSAHDDPGERLRSILELSEQGRPALEKLTTLLESDDRSTRRNALLALADMGPEAEQALAAIRQRFSDQDSSVRQCALMAFSKICDDQDQVLTAAAGFLADPEPRVREAAAGTLQAAGPSAISALIKMAHSESADARQLVIRLLTDVDRQRDPGAVNFVLRSLLDDLDGVIRLQAITAVVSRGAAQFDEIRGWLREEDPKVVEAGLWAVCLLDPQAAAAALPELEALLEDTAVSPLWAMGALSHLKSAARPLIPTLLRRGAALNSSNRFYVAKTLVEIGADACDIVPILIPLLSSEKDHYNLCWQAGQLLAQISPDEARRQVSRLICEITVREKESFAHEDSDLNALMGLGSQAQEAVPLLIRLLSHPSRPVPSMAMSTLREIGPDAAPAVSTLLALIDREPWAIRALGGIGPAARAAVPKLLELIDNGDADVGVDVAWALGQIGDASPEVLAALRRHLTTTVVLSRQEIHLSHLRVAALQSLVLLAADSARTLSDVMPLLDDKDLDVHVLAILAIGHFSGDRRDVIEQLIEALDDDNVRVRTASALALGEIGPDANAAVPVLRSFLGDRRNTIRHSFLLSGMQWPNGLFTPGGLDLNRLSLAEAARWAISAIETPASQTAGEAVTAAGEHGRLVFSTRRWDREFTSQDIVGGVETTPVVAAIQSIRDDGTDLTKMVDLGQRTEYPVPSPDGEWVYFQSNATGRSQVYRCRWDGSQVTNLTAGDRLGKNWREAFGFVLSRDGRQMLYTVHDGSRGQIAIAGADGLDPYFMAPQLGYIYRVDADAKDVQRLTQGNNYVEFRLSPQDSHGSTDGPQISPDGRSIAYMAVRDGVSNIWVTGIEGAGTQQVTFRIASCGRVRWSANGRELAFVSFVGKYPQLFIVPIEGGEPRQLTHLDAAVYFVEWAPDKRRQE